MVQPVVSSFFWRSWSSFQKFRHYWGSHSQEFKRFVQSIQDCSLEVIGKEPPNGASYSILHRAMAYLTENSDPKVEAIVRKKFQTALPQTIQSYLEHLVKFSSQIDNLQIFNTAEKIFEYCSMQQVFQIELDKARAELVPEIRKIYQDILRKIHSEIEDRTPPNPTSEQKLFWLNHNCEQVYKSILEKFETEKDHLSEQKEMCLKEIFDHLKAQYNLKKTYEQLQQIDEGLIQKIIKKILPEINFNYIQSPLRQASQSLIEPHTPSIQRTFTSIVHVICFLSANLLTTFSYFLFNYIYTLSLAFGVPKYEKPASLLDAQSQMTFYQTSFIYVRWLTDHYFQLFSTRKKAVEASFLITVFLFLLYRFFKKIHSDSPEFFKQWTSSVSQEISAKPKSNPFRDLTQEAAKGKLQPIFGRNEEMKELIGALSSPDSISAPRIVIIVGDSGVGKTSLIEELALRIIKQEARILNHKFVITPNRDFSVEKSSDSSKKMTSIQETLEIIKGREIDHILYIRRAHQLKKNTLADLVDKVEKTHLRVILSTTPIDLPGSLAPISELMKNSILLHLPSLDSISTYCVLTRMITFYNSTHTQTIDPHLARYIVDESLTLKGVEPHNSIQILLNLISMLDSHIPSKPPFLDLFMRKRLELSADYVQAEEDDVIYPLTLEGQIHGENIKILDEKIQQLNQQFSESIKLQHKADNFLRKKKIIEEQYSKNRSKLSEPNADRTRLEKRLFFWLCILKNFKKQESQKIRLDFERLISPIDISSLESREIISKQDLNECSHSSQNSIYPPLLCSQSIREYCHNLRKQQQETFSSTHQTQSQDKSQKARRTSTPGQSPLRGRKVSWEHQEDSPKYKSEEGFPLRISEGERDTANQRF